MRFGQSLALPLLLLLVLGLLIGQTHGATGVTSSFSRSLAGLDQSTRADDLVSPPLLPTSQGGAASWGAPVQVNPSDPAILGVESPAAAVQDKTLYVVWVGIRQEGYDYPKDLYFARSDDGGVTWSSSGAPLVPSLPPGAQAQTPSLVATPEGTLFVAWYLSYWDEGVGEIVREIRVIRSTDGGESWPWDTTIADAPGLHPEPRLAADDAGTLYLAWEEAVDEGEGSRLQVQMTRSQNGGESWDAVTTAIYDLADPSCEPVEWDMAAAGEGVVYIVVADACTGVWFVKSTDGGQTWSAQRTIYTYNLSPKDIGVDVALEGSERLYVVGKDAHETFCEPCDGDIPVDDLLWARSEDGGATWESAVLVSGGLLDANGHPYGVYKAALTAGSRRVIVGHAYDTFYDPGFYLMESADGGQSWGAEVQVGSLEDWSDFTVAIDPACGTTAVALWVDANGDLLASAREAEPVAPLCLRVSATRLTRNEEGWPVPNPLRVEVTLTCPAGEYCSDYFMLRIESGDGGRFYVYEQSGEVDSEVPVVCGVIDFGPDHYSFHSYVDECHPEDEQIMTLYGGQQAQIRWSVWVQPSVTATLEVEATWESFSAHRVVSVAQARIHPILFLPGILGTMPPSERSPQGQIDPVLGIYDPLLTTLAKMGYVRGQTLYAVGYDWRNSNRVSADLLDEKIEEQLGRVAELPYVNHDGKVDLVVHSMGGLVSRAYIQGYGVDDENGDAPISYDGDVRKVVFIASPHRGFPIDYRTREGLTWDDYLYEENEGHLRVLLNDVLWPQWIAKKYGALRPPEDCFWLPGSCEPEVFDPYGWSHDPERGIQSLAEMLPTEDVPAYLCDRLGTEGCAPGGAYPYGHEVNPLLNDMNATVQDLADALGPENIYVIYGTDWRTDHWYEVTAPPPTGWAYGRPITLDVNYDDDFETEQGDDLIPVYSTNLKELLDSIPTENVKSLSRKAARHKQIMYHARTQSEFVPTFLTGQAIPFTTPYWQPPFLIHPGQWLVLTELCPVNLTLTDPQGRRVGYDPATGGVLAEVPDALYTGPGVEGQFIIVPRAPAGDYQITATGFDTGEYTLLVYRQVMLYRDDVLLDSASILPQLDQWYRVKVERDGESGEIAVYLDEGEGYPAWPLLEAVDTTYPALGRFGIGYQAAGFELYDDWVEVKPWEVGP